MGGAGSVISIVVNGEGREIPQGSTVRNLLDRLGLEGPHVAVARNLELVPRSEYDATRLESGDRIEVVHAVGGGAT